jgi:hypothetical protein
MTESQELKRIQIVFLNAAVKLPKGKAKLDTVSGQNTPTATAAAVSWGDPIISETRTIRWTIGLTVHNPNSRRHDMGAISTYLPSFWGFSRQGTHLALVKHIA